MDRRKSDERRRSTDADMLDVRELALRVWRHKRLTVLIFLVPALASLIWLTVRPDVYQATASIILDDQNQTLASFSDAFATTKFDDMTVDTQAKVLSSPGLIHEVIDTLGLHFERGRMAVTKTDEAAQALPREDEAAQYKILKTYSQNLSVAPVPQSRVIEISFKAADPYLAAAIANAHAKQYVASEIRIRKEQIELIRKWIAGQVTALREDSTRKAQAIQDFQQRSGMVAGRNSEDLIYQQISELSTQLATLEDRRLELQARANTKGRSDTIDVMQSLVIQDLKKQESAARQDFQVLAATYGPNHPKYIEAEKKVRQIEDDLTRETGKIRASVAGELATVTSQESLLRQHMEEAKAQAGEIRQEQVALQSYQQDAAASSKLLDSFLAQYGEAGSQLEFARADVRIGSLADIPMEPAGVRKILLLPIILFLSALFAMGAAAMLSLWGEGAALAGDVKKTPNLRQFANDVPQVQRNEADVKNAQGY